MLDLTDGVWTSFQVRGRSWRNLSIWPIGLLRSDQIRSVTQSCPTLCDPMNRSTPGLPVHHQLPEFTQTQRPSSQWCHPAISSSVAPFSFCPQSFPASGSFPVSQLFISKWPKFSSFSFSISPSNEYSRLISFRIDWFDLLAVQGTLKSLLKHHSSKASVHDAHPSLWYNSHPYMTTGKTMAFTI